MGITGSRRFETSNLRMWRRTAWKDRRFKFNSKREPRMTGTIKRFYVTNGKTTNQRFAETAEQAAISESKLYESDDLVLDVREEFDAFPRKFRVNCRTSYSVQEIKPEPAVAPQPVEPQPEKWQPTANKLEVASK